MKKFMKGCAITALVMCVLGAVLGTVASSIAGRTSISTIVNAATGGRVQLNLSNWRDWNIEVIEDIGGRINYSIDDATSFYGNIDVLSGTVEKFSLGNDITDLDIEVGGCKVETRPSADDNFYIEAKRAGKLQAFVEERELHIVSTVNSHHITGENFCEIILYVPTDFRFREAEVQMGAGSLVMDELLAAEASLEVGAGQIELKKVEVSDLDISVGMGVLSVDQLHADTLSAEVGMGKLTAVCDIESFGELECNMGTIELEVIGRQDSFNYVMEGSMGNIDVGGDSYSGFTQEKTINNNAKKRLEISGTMGNISLQFTE